MPASIPMTRHAEKRLAGRSLCSGVLNLILCFGDAHRRHGADVYTINRRLRAEIIAELGWQEFRRVERKLRSYVVVGDDGSVITAAFRTKRLKFR